MPPIVYGGSAGPYHPTVVRYLAQDGTPIGSYSLGQSVARPTMPDNALKITPNGTLVYIVRDYTGVQGNLYNYGVGIIGSSTLNVTSSPGVPLTLSPGSPLSDGENDQNYSTTITAIGGNGAYSYTVTGGLPSGLTLSSGGLLSGVPTAPGTYNFTVTANDTVGDSGSQAYTLVIHSLPAITTTGLTLATVKDSYRQVLTYTGGSGSGYTFGENGILPAGLSFNTTTGTFSGTPTQSGTFNNIQVTLTDSLGGTATQTYSLTVDPAITFSPATLPAGAVGMAYIQTFTAAGAPAAPRPITASASPTAASPPACP